MKKIFFALMMMIPVLSGCFIVIPVDPSFTITDGSYKTNYILTKNGEQSFAICNDLNTTLDYEFEFNGTLIAWESYLKGDQDSVAGRFQFVPGDGKADINYTTKTVKARYLIPPGTAPRLVASVAAISNLPNITVNPNAVIVGYSTLYITAEGFSGAQVLDSEKMAVVDNCKDFLN